MDLEKKLNLEVVSQENYEQYTKESKVIHEKRREINSLFHALPRSYTRLIRFGYLQILFE